MRRIVIGNRATDRLRHFLRLDIKYPREYRLNYIFPSPSRISLKAQDRSVRAISYFPYMVSDAAIRSPLDHRRDTKERIRDVSSPRVSRRKEKFAPVRSAAGGSGVRTSDSSATRKTGSNGVLRRTNERTNGGPVLPPSMKRTVRVTRMHRTWEEVSGHARRERGEPSHWPDGQSRHGPGEDDRRSWFAV